MGVSTSSTKILGVSHLVYGVTDYEPAQTFLTGLGYKLKGEQPNGANPVEKTPFASGKMSARFQMRLLASDRGGPGIELLKEDHGPAKELSPVFEGLLSETPELELPSLPQLLSQAPLEHNFRRLAPTARNFSGMVVRCANLKKSLALWEFLGLKTETLSPTMAVARVPRLLAKGGFPLVLVEDGSHRFGRLGVNQPGITCVAFFRSEVDVMRGNLVAESSKLSAEIGDCFDLTPLDRKLRMFFLRKDEAQIYSLVTVLRT